jgi:prophage regulatory protein
VQILLRPGGVPGKHEDKMSEKFLRMPAVREATGLGRSTIYRLVSAGKFPRPLKILGPHVVAFLESEIIEWQRERVNAREAAAPKIA